MNRLLATASALTVLAIASQASPAFAADLAARTAPVYTKAPEYAPVMNSWAGLYIGGNVGYGWGDNNTDISFLPSPASFGLANESLNNRSTGVFGGAQLGYNWQIGSIVTGLEADIQGSGIKGSAGPITANSVPSGTPFVPSNLVSSHEILWFGTVRGRLGVTVVPSLLLYGTGGLAYGGVKGSADANEPADGIPVGTLAQTVSKTQVGWTAGAGLEWMFSRGWSAKVEYLHVDLGNVSATAAFDNGTLGTTYTFHNQFDTVRVGVNYHFN
jgi:outer membrane immunogenic protein